MLLSTIRLSGVPTPITTAVRHLRLQNRSELVDTYPGSDGDGRRRVGIVPLDNVDISTSRGFLLQHEVTRYDDTEGRASLEFATLDS